MNKIEKTFRKIFHPDIIENGKIVPFRQGRKVQYKITLEEESNKIDYSKAGLMYKVSLIGFDEVYFAINFDKYDFLHGRKLDSEKFNDCLLIADDIRKACDNIVWGNICGKDVVLIELKSKNNKNVPAKFKSAKCFLSYLYTILFEFYNFNADNFIVIPLLLNAKTGKSFIENDIDGFKFYRKGLKSEAEYYIKRDLEKILKIK